MRTALVLLALLGLGGLAIADPPVPGAPSAPGAKPQAPAPAAKPAPPLTPEQAADVALAAVKAKDDAVLKALAAKDDPDPWLVADELIRRGEHDVAKAFAKAAPRVDVEKLPEYVASRRGKADDAGRRARLAAANDALMAGTPDRALNALGSPEDSTAADVVLVRLLLVRGYSLTSLVRFNAAASTLLAAGEAAGRIGWLSCADIAFDMSAQVAYRGSELAAAQAACERRLSITAQRGDKRGAAATLGNLGLISVAFGDYVQALRAQKRALAAMEELGDELGAARALANAALAHYRLGQFPQALAAYERALAVQEALGDRVGAANDLVGIGSVHLSLGDRTKALTMFDRALAVQLALADQVGAAITLRNIGTVHTTGGDYALALEMFHRALGVQEKAGDRAGAAATLGNIGLSYDSLGDYASALATQERALRAKEAIGDKGGAALTLGNIGLIYLHLGDYARALATLERALTAKERLGDRAGVAETLVGVGSVYRSTGDSVRALAMYERARAENEELGNRTGAAIALGSIGNVYLDGGETAKALATYERVLKGMESRDDKVMATSIRGNIGSAYFSMGNYEKALAAWGRALSAKEEMGDKVGAAEALGNVGSVQFELGDHVKALATWERALAAQESLGDKARTAATLGNIGNAKYRLHDWAGAIDAARRGTALVPLLFSGLGDEQGAAARAQHAKLFTVGARAAAELHDSVNVSEFIERGRAGSLLEALGARASLQSGLLPSALVAEEAQARAKEVAASQAYRRVLDGGDLTAIRTRRRELDEAQAAIVASVERIQREAKSAANVVHFRPDALDAIRARLTPGEALVLYGLFDEGPLALVVTPSGATTVNLPATKDIQAACEALLAAIDSRGGAEVLVKAVDALHDLVVKPLGLSPETKRLLISPDGTLSYVPFALLAPEREVVYVPSGTAYGLLLEDGKARGDGVLALGDPDYASKVDERAAGIYTRGAVGKLERLPATADEARTVGATVLLGKDATEKGLREAVAKRTRWRSVHFACHGLIDAERPGFSSLALTSDGDDDGFLTVLEVFRSKIPADLVVLSACETAKGKVVKGEGMMGLTRAFMFAGSPRVICSLWKVDDAATKALMVRFYELWNPKDPAKAMGTAAALKAAQEYIRTYETEVPDVDASQREGRAVTKRVRPWEHPYYWAAWVLWGLPS